MKQKLSIIGLISLVSIALDQWTKVLATRYLLPQETAISWWNDFFVLTYSINHGAFLGLGHTLPEDIRNFIFSGLVGVFLLGFLIYCLRTPMTQIQNIACGLVLSGGFSNLYDRITNNGGVVDFMNMGIGDLRTGIFNVADIAIMLGVILLAIYTKPQESKE
jgi:signal peptidase II